MKIEKRFDENGNRIKFCKQCQTDQPFFKTQICKKCNDLKKYQKTQKYQIELAEKEFGPLYKSGTYLFYHQKTGETFNIYASKCKQINQKFFPYLCDNVLYFQLLDQKGNKQNTFIKDNNKSIKFELKNICPQGKWIENAMVKKRSMIDKKNKEIDDVLIAFTNTCIVEVNNMQSDDKVNYYEDSLEKTKGNDRNKIFDECQVSIHKLIPNFNNKKNKIYNKSTKTTNDEIFGRTPLSDLFEYKLSTGQYVNLKEDFRYDYYKLVKHFEVPVKANQELSDLQNSKNMSGIAYVIIIEKHMKNDELKRFRACGAREILIDFIDKNKFYISSQKLYEAIYYNKNYLKSVHRLLLPWIYA